MGDESRNIPQYDTRLEAQKSIASKVSDLEAQILDFIRARPTLGATCAEIEQSLGLSHQTASSRLTNLCQKLGVIRDSGSRRKTGSGRAARVYVMA